MKGVILSIAAEATIVDITHDMPPQDVPAGALALAAAAPCFPPQAIHVAVVDPGVGGSRKAVAVATAAGTLVGPDNGLFSAVLQTHPATAVVELSDDRFHRRPVSPTFHGRDIFAPVAAHLARGVALADLGPPLPGLLLLPLPQPIPEGHALLLQVIHVDRFGNLVTNLTRERFDAWAAAHLSTQARPQWRLGTATVTGLSRTYGDVPVGHLGAYFGSSGRLEIGQRNGDAAEFLGARVGNAVHLRATESDAT